MEKWRLKRPTWRWLPSAESTVRFLLVYLIILVTAKFGQQIFYTWQTSPAILWPPTGIGVAIMWLYGYRYAIPIFLGLLIASLSGPGSQPLPQALITPLSMIVGQLAGVYFLHHMQFEGVFADMRNVLVFFIAIVLLAIISPALTTTISYLTGTLDASYITVFSRRWAGYAFSCLILTPFIIAWAYHEADEYRNTFIEACLAGILVALSTYLLFWTRLPAQYGFIFFGLFFLAVIWVCLRFSSRIVTLSVVFITVLGILGLFMMPVADQPLNARVFAAELFLFIVVPIMYAYSALVKERERNTRRLKLALAEIEMENANKTKFIAVLAHELRNPLAPVKTTLEIMKLQKLAPDIKELVISANAQVHTMRRLLDDLLDVTRVTQGKFALKMDIVPFSLILNNVVNTTKGIITERGHTLQVQGRTKDDLCVHVDPMRFEQVLVNVINNAAKFTEPGGDMLLTYKVKGDNLEIRIRDNGKGIEAKNLERIFRSFWQISEASEQPSSGIGVGLALARQIVELHGGTMHAESEGLGRGSTFVINVPKATPPAMPHTVRAVPSISPLSFSILIVDDNKLAADTLAKLLTIKGHRVTTAYSGKEALMALEVTKPDIILLDIGLGDMSGYDVATAIREKGYTGTLIALSGYGQEGDKRRALATGFDHHFTKPMALDNFEAYLRTAPKLARSVLND